MPGGLADHTVLLAQRLTANRRVEVLTSLGAEPGVGLRVSATVGSWSDSAGLLRQFDTLPREAAIVWQYVPHMYGRGGINRSLPKVMAALRGAGRHQIVIAHEIMAPLSWRPRLLWCAWNHRWQWRCIRAVADQLAISTERWVEHWMTREPRIAPKLSLLPSPSNVPSVTVSEGHREAWRQRFGWPPEMRVLAHFGSGAAGKQVDWIYRAWEAAESELGPMALVIAGGRPDQAPPESRQSRYRFLGHLPAAELAEMLRAVDVLALPFVDGVSERRGSFMAGLEAGVSVATTLGHSTGTTLRNADFLAATAEDDLGGYCDQVRHLLQDEPRRRALAARGQAAYRKNYSWDVVTRRLEGLIDSPPSVDAGPATVATVSK